MGELVVEKSIELDAPAEKIWEQLVDVKSWPEWKPFITKARIAGYDSLTNGARIKMSLLAGGPAAAPLSVTVNAFDKPRYLSWEGGIKGLLHAEHSFCLEEKGGKTRVTTYEKFAGPLLWFMLRLAPREDLEQLHEKWLQAIKARLEPDAPAEEGGPVH